MTELVSAVRVGWVPVPASQVYPDVQRTERLSSGSYRRVWDLDTNHVLKVCRDDGCCLWSHGYLADERGYTVSNCPCVKEGYLSTVSGDPALARVVAFGPCWCIMEKVVKTFAQVPEPRDDRSFTQVTRRLRQDYFLDDLHKHNLGYDRRGQLVAIDYGGY